MGKIHHIKMFRRQVRKENQRVAFQVVRQIYDQPILSRLMIAFNIIFKRGE